MKYVLYVHMLIGKLAMKDVLYVHMLIGKLAMKYVIYVNTAQVLMGKLSLTIRNIRMFKIQSE